MQASEIWEGCNVDDYALAIGKSCTNVANALNQLVNFGFRYTQPEEIANYTRMSQAVLDNDPNIAGETLGLWLKAFMMVENESSDDYNQYYTEVDYINA